MNIVTQAEWKSQIACELNQSNNNKKRGGGVGLQNKSVQIYCQRSHPFAVDNFAVISEKYSLSF